ncbi:MAG: DUF3656 domain-containing protein [Clostridia bacterium]|nr:DUF3656 domain-containing protein [Clostridia bacterium]
MEHRPELLAPAGNWDALVAAVQNGADAVYLGAQSFNARQSADNFDAEGLARAVEYAHVRDVRVYVVVNILISDTELEDAVRLLESLHRLGVDGVIVQDLGLAAVARALMPGLPLHASTQMTVHNVKGAQYLKELGFKRVVPARELTLEEIGLLRSEGGLEVETFIHGALCFSYSGQCLMSSLIGGRSGNRGRCAQPCRLPYALVGEGGRPVETEVTGNYLLSPRDLNLSAHLPDLINAGVDAFKIEGRLRRAEYVAVVVSVYRKLLDRALTGKYYVSGEEQRTLAQAFNRGFTTGHLFGRAGRELMNYTRSNNRGIAVGRVKRLLPAERRVEIALDGPLAEGDIVDFWVKVGGRIAVTVSDLRINGKTADSGGAGQLASFPAQGRIRAGDRAFKVLDAEMVRRARETFSSSREQRRIPLVFSVRVREGAPVELEVQDRADRKVHVRGTVLAVPALNRPLTPEVIAAQMERLGNTPFTADEVRAEIEGEVLVPLGELNALRREALSRLEERRIAERLPDSAVVSEAEAKLAEWAGRRKRPAAPALPGKAQLAVTTTDLDGVKAAADGGADIVYFPGDSLGRATIPRREEILEAAELCRKWGTALYFSFPRILRASEFGKWEALFEAVSGDISGVMVTNLGLLGHFSGHGLKVAADFPLNIFNSETVALLARSGVERVTLSPEMTIEQVRELRKNGIKLETLVQGAVPMMITEHCVPGSLLDSENRRCQGVCRKGQRFFLRDRKDELFPVGTDVACRMHIFNPKDLCVVEQVPALLEAGITSLRIEGRIKDAAYIGTATRVYRTVLDKAARLDSFAALEAKERLRLLSPSGITTGHYFRGVL